MASPAGPSAVAGHVVERPEDDELASDRKDDGSKPGHDAYEDSCSEESGLSRGAFAAQFEELGKPAERTGGNALLRSTAFQGVTSPIIELSSEGAAPASFGQCWHRSARRRGQADSARTADAAVGHTAFAAIFEERSFLRSVRRRHSHQFLPNELSLLGLAGGRGDLPRTLPTAPRQAGERLERKNAKRTDCGCIVRRG